MTLVRDLPSKEKSTFVASRSIRSNCTLLKLSDDSYLESRRFIPVGKGDKVCNDNNGLFVFVKNDMTWIEIGTVWKKAEHVKFAGKEIEIKFKEIETSTEYKLFSSLRKFHYRGGGGAGRIVPIIATTTTWDLPEVLGFIELSSSMIANTARKNFFNSPYWEQSGIGWNKWDRSATKKFSNIIVRISRFVIHPEIRGLGLAKCFLNAAAEYAKDRWHYGGFKPRFLEITADMLRYYKFLGSEFVYLGDTEGNEHRVSKDMSYLVRKALSPDGPKAMPQGGGGVMTMQRGYASQLLEYMKKHDLGFKEIINTLQYEPEHLDQVTWEALYKLNRRPKPCYAMGISKSSEEYLRKRAEIIHQSKFLGSQDLVAAKENQTFQFREIEVRAQAELFQSNDSRKLQDTFGFVGSHLNSVVVEPLSFDIKSGTVTLICGASGSGKSLLGYAIRSVCNNSQEINDLDTAVKGIQIKVRGFVEPLASFIELEPFDPSAPPLQKVNKDELSKFLKIGAMCGLAEPQLFVRPFASLSSGQKYRLQVAFAFMKQPDIVHIDNFCESLDRYTTAAVCNGIMRLASITGTAVMVATAAYENVLRYLEPEKVVLLRRGNPAVVGVKREVLAGEI